MCPWHRWRSWETQPITDVSAVWASGLSASSAIAGASRGSSAARFCGSRRAPLYHQRMKKAREHKDVVLGLNTLTRISTVLNIHRHWRSFSRTRRRRMRGSEGRIEPSSSAGVRPPRADGVRPHGRPPDDMAPSRCLAKRSLPRPLGRRTRSQGGEHRLSVMDDPLRKVVGRPRVRSTKRTHRLIPSRFPAVAGFDDAASAADLEAVIEFEGWTNGRIVETWFRRLPRLE